ncbi:hypothetical protein [Streptomyces viridosporus]|uniref:hypothetical protein n=1 Tax=Streptomyces viridosporus TaxID=67581 RepID=UPI001356CE7E|nr:hypothetical protein [Streptomyces viridosporus]
MPVFWHPGIAREPAVVIDTTASRTCRPGELDAAAGAAYILVPDHLRAGHLHHRG